MLIPIFSSQLPQASWSRPAPSSVQRNDPPVEISEVPSGGWGKTWRKQTTSINFVAVVDVVVVVVVDVVVTLTLTVFVL